MRFLTKRICPLLLTVSLLFTLLPVTAQTALAEVVQEELQTAQDYEILQSMAELETISEDTPVEEQIIVVYEESREDNVQTLSLPLAEVAQGESLSDTVDVLTLEDSSQVDEVIQQLEQTPGVAAASRNGLVEIDSLPNDPYIQNGVAWQFETVGADQVWNSLGSGSTVKVAVLDTGVNVNHEDLRGRVEIGYDYVLNSSSSMRDLAGHGTSVSGLIVATANNGLGIAGIAGSADIQVVAYRVGGTTASDRYLKTSYIVAALEEVADRSDIQVVNMSFGSDSPSSAERAAIASVRESGKILVASAGNDGDTRYSYPASLDGVISAGATKSDNTIASFSNRNDAVDLCAPGYRVATTDTSGGYVYANGTSFSAPLTAGAAAVLKYVNPALDADQVEQILKDTALDLGASGKDNVYGYGLIQLEEAVAAARNTTVTTPLEIEYFGTYPSSSIVEGSDVTVSARASGGSGTLYYRFTATSSAGTTVIQDYDSQRSVTWEQPPVGSYTLRVQVKDEEGSIQSQTCSFQVVENANSVELYPWLYFDTEYTTDVQRISAEETIRLRWETNFSFSYVKITAVSESGQEEVLQDYTYSSLSENGFVSWTPTEPGSYTLHAYAYRSGMAETVYQDQIEIEVVDASQLVAHFAAPYESTSYENSNNLIFNTLATGGSGEYEYRYTASHNGTVQVLQDFSPQRRLLQCMVFPGDWVFTVTVRDSDGQEVTLTKEIYLAADEPEFQSLYLDNVTVGRNATIRYDVSGGVGEYDCRVTVTQNGATDVILDYGEEPDTVSNNGTHWEVYWTPQKSGICVVRVYVRDEAGTVSSYQTEREISYAFNDVSEDAWFFEASEYAAARGIITGQGGQPIFDATGEVSRATFAVMLHRMSKDIHPDYVESPSYQTIFPDIADGEFFTSAVLWCNQEGLITGYDEGTFGPGDSLTREQLVTILYRYAVDLGLDSGRRANLSAYPDGDRVSAFAYEAMRWAVAEGIISGQGDTRELDPQGVSNRAHCATILMRFLEKFDL